MRYTVRFDSESESEETCKILDVLSRNYRLSTFVRLALESYISSDVGRRMYTSLAGNGGKKNTRRGKKREVCSTESATVKKTQAAPVPAPTGVTGQVQRQVEVKSSTQTNSGAEAPAKILGRIFS